jgi:hypothetical protein
MWLKDSMSRTEWKGRKEGGGWMRLKDSMSRTEWKGRKDGGGWMRLKDSMSWAEWKGRKDGGRGRGGELGLVSDFFNCLFLIPMFSTVLVVAVSPSISAPAPFL